MGAALTLLTTFFGVSTESGTYQVIFAINQALSISCRYLSVIPVRREKSNAYLGAFLGAILLFITINLLADSSFMGIPVANIGYNASVFPIILGCIFMSFIYKGLSKVMPVSLRTIFVPLLTMLITVPVTLIVLGPIGNWAGTLLADGVYAIYKAVPALAAAIIGALTCWMVFFGMNNATYPIVFVLLAEVGLDPLISCGYGTCQCCAWWSLSGHSLNCQKGKRKISNNRSRYHRIMWHY